MMRWRTTLGAAVLAATLGAPGVARAEVWEDAGWGLLTVLGNLGYMPAKVLYATAGAITGGLAWAVTGGNTDVAGQVWMSSLGGDYVLTPSMIRGDEPITFAAFPGERPGAYRDDPDASSDPEGLREETLSGL